MLWTKRADDEAELADPLGLIKGHVSEQIVSSNYMRTVQIRGVCQIMSILKANKFLDTIFNRCGLKHFSFARATRVDQFG